MMYKSIYTDKKSSQIICKVKRNKYEKNILEVFPFVLRKIPVCVCVCVCGYMQDRFGRIHKHI